jgi:calcineurin-like phosphoesterase family protein
MVDYWNETVAPDNYVLHLGDLYMNKNQKVRSNFLYNIAPKLNGRKFLILGNHDTESEEFYKQADFNIVKPFTIKYEGMYVGFDHYPCARGEIQKSDDYIRVHGHLHNNGYQGQHVKLKERKRLGNINVSVEEIGYRPQSITELLDAYMRGMKIKQKYHNVNKIGAKVAKAR